MTTTYYSVTTDAFSTFLNDFIISGSTTLDLTGWSVKLGTGNLQPTHETTDLINVIYDKDTTGYLGFTASVYASGGQLISIPIPNSVLEGNIITEIGLYDSNDVLMCAAATYLDLTRTSAQGLQPNFIEQLVLKDIPSGVTVVYETWDDYQLRNEKNQASGYAGLDENAKVPLANLPTNLSVFTDDLGSNPVHTHSQYSYKDLSNLSNNGNAKFQYAPFSINNGTVDVNGKNNTIGFLAQTSYKKYNFTENGTLTKNKDIISGFSTNNYISLPNNFNVSNGETWEMVFKVTTGNDISTNQAIIGTSGISTNKDPVMILLYQNKFGTQITYTATGTVYDFYANNITINPNTTYLIKLEFTGTAYNLYINGVLGASLTSSTSIYMSGLVLGIQSGLGGSLTNPWLGSISLNESYININSSNWWQGIIEGTSNDYDYMIQSGIELICQPCTITTADSRTKIFDSVTTLDCSTFADGTYSVLKDYNNGVLELVSSLTTDKIAPLNPANGDCWLDNSVIPLSLKIYNGSEWEINNDKVHLGNVTISSGVITDVYNNSFNSYYNKLCAELGMPSGNYKALTAGASGATYTAKHNGYFVTYCTKNTTSAAMASYGYVDGNLMFYNTIPTTTTSSGLGHYCPVKKGQVFKWHYDYTNNSAKNIVDIGFIKAEGDV